MGARADPRAQCDRSRRRVKFPSRHLADDDYAFYFDFFLPLSATAWVYSEAADC